MLLTTASLSLYGVSWCTEMMYWLWTSHSPPDSITGTCSTRPGLRELLPRVLSLRQAWSMQVDGHDHQYWRTHSRSYERAKLLRDFQAWSSSRRLQAWSSPWLELELISSYISNERPSIVVILFGAKNVRCWTFHTLINLPYHSTRYWTLNRVRIKLNSMIQMRPSLCLDEQDYCIWRLTRYDEVGESTHHSSQLYILNNREIAYDTFLHLNFYLQRIWKSHIHMDRTPST